MIKKIVIVGGGTAGWMTASAFAKHLPEHCEISLIESEQISTVGVGEATIPVIRTFNASLGIDEREFMSATNASFKLGIRFENWGQLGDAYNHAFGYFGSPIEGLSFHHYWMMQNSQSKVAPFHSFNVPAVASDMGRYAHRQYQASSFDSKYFYAFQFDAALYAKYLRNWSEKRGVTRIEGKVSKVNVDQKSGIISSVEVDEKRIVEADLFIDCTGFRALLIGQTLGVNFLDWSHYLPVNRAWAVSSTYPDDKPHIPPYTRARALEAGWQWRIPLQNRSGDGNVFCDKFISEEKGLSQLLENIEGEPINEPRLLKFVTGKREKLWEKNCVAIGLSAGFLEPLESTSIALIQGAIMALLRNFPCQQHDPHRAHEFNTKLHHKYEESRDFLILHYKATERNDTPFWDYCRNMSIPDELQHRIELFKKTGVVSNTKADLFQEHNWLAVLIGQGIYPEHFDPRVYNIPQTKIKEILQYMHGQTDLAVTKMPEHKDTLREYCAGDLIS